MVVSHFVGLQDAGRGEAPATPYAFKASLCEPVACTVSCIPLAFSAPYIVYRRMFLSFWASIFMLHKTKKRGGKDDEDGEKK
jgi:hypothetical protein